MKDIINRNIKRDLLCTVAESDLLIHAKAAAERRHDIAVEKDKEAKRVKAHKEAVLELEAKVAHLDMIVRTGKEPREVVCFEQFVNGVVELVREDTGEVVETRQATARDRQTDAMVIGLLDRAAEMKGDRRS